jgi:hypothetical protein
MSGQGRSVSNKRSGKTGAPSADVVRSALATDLAPKIKRDVTEDKQYPRGFRIFQEDTTLGARQIEMVMNHPDILIIEMEHVLWNKLPYMRVIYEDRLSTTDEYENTSTADVLTLLAMRDIVYEQGEKSVITHDTDPHPVTKPSIKDELG